MLKIAVSGIKGRMGKSISECLLEHNNLSLSCATSVAGDDCIGNKALSNNQDVIITDKLTNDFDILIDFTSIESTFSNLEFCKKNNKPIVIGTTGFNEDELKKIKDYSKFIPVFQSANMSLGVNIMQQLVATAAKALYKNADIEIIEAHHKHKVDAPSGTALMIGKSIADAINISLEEKAVYARDGIIGERKDGEIGFSTIRGGDVVGEHSAIYYMQGERLEISHKATDRKIFARGALFAAEFLASKDKGYYNMFDALGL